MPQTYKIDQAATFAGVALLSVEPKVAFGGTEQDRTSDGVPKWGATSSSVRMHAAVGGLDRTENHHHPKGPPGTTAPPLRCCGHPGRHLLGEPVKRMPHLLQPGIDPSRTCIRLSNARAIRNIRRNVRHRRIHPRIHPGRITWMTYSAPTTLDPHVEQDQQRWRETREILVQCLIIDFSLAEVRLVPGRLWRGSVRQ
jgi:hypothetical protein